MHIKGSPSQFTLNRNRYTIEEMFESIVNNTVWDKLPVNHLPDVLKMFQHIVKHSHRPYVDMYNFLTGEYTHILGCQAYLHPEQHPGLEAGITINNILYIIKMIAIYSDNRMVVGTLAQKTNYWSNHVHTGVG